MKTQIIIPPGKLAIEPWYETEPEHLETEVKAMEASFPQFVLHRRSDGKLFWTGTLRPGLLGEDGWDWHIDAVYQNDHPYTHMGNSVHVYLRKPDFDTLFEATGWYPRHLFRDAEGVYLCTSCVDYSNGYNGNTYPSASTFLRRTVKWLAAYELVLAGKLTKKEFDNPNGI